MATFLIGTDDMSTRWQQNPVLDLYHTTKATLTSGGLIEEKKHLTIVRKGTMDFILGHQVIKFKFCSLSAVLIRSLTHILFTDLYWVKVYVFCAPYATPADKKNSLKMVLNDPLREISFLLYCSQI